MYRTSNVQYKSQRPQKEIILTPSSSTKSFRRKGSKLKLARLALNTQYHPIQQKQKRKSIYYDNTKALPQNENVNNLLIKQMSKHSQTTTINNLSNEYSLTPFTNISLMYSNIKSNQMNKKLILKLQKQIERKNQQIRNYQGKHLEFKQIQEQLKQTYRVIHYYQGKIKQYQKIHQYHQHNYINNISTNHQQLRDNLTFKDVIEFFKNQSIQLRGQLEKRNHQFIKVQNQCRTFQNKYTNLIKQSNEKPKKNQINPYEAENLKIYTPINTQKKKAASIYQARLQNSKNKLSMRRADDEGSQISGKSQSSRGVYKSFVSNKQFVSTERRIIPSASKQKLQIGKIYGNFTSKINRIEKELDYFKIQNDKIQNQLNQTIIQIGQLRVQNDQLKVLLQQKSNQSSAELINNKKFNFKRQTDPLNKVTILQKNIIPMNKKDSYSTNATSLTQKRQYSNASTNKQQLKKLNFKQVSAKLKKSQGYSFKIIKAQTIRKLRYNLIRQDINYSNFIDILVQKLRSKQPQKQTCQTLSQHPYNLQTNQILQLCQQSNSIFGYIKQKQLTQTSLDPTPDLSAQIISLRYKQQLKQILMRNIQPFKNLTIRKENSINSQVTRIWKNRTQEVDNVLKHNKTHIIFQQAQGILQKQWALTQDEIQYTFLKNCQLTQQYKMFSFHQTAQFFLNN